MNSPDVQVGQVWKVKSRWDVDGWDAPGVSLIGDKVIIIKADKESCHVLYTEGRLQGCTGMGWDIDSIPFFFERIE